MNAMSRCCCWFSCLLLASASIAAGAEPRRPNVIVILADDLGYECLGVDGGTSYRTPNLDRLARSGAHFDACFAQPNCTPTRVQMMTGMYNVRNYVQFGLLDPSAKTFAHLFRDAGYATCIAGKWQLGGKGSDAPKHFGFDRHCLWSYMGRGSRYADPTLTIDGKSQTFSGKYGPDICYEFVVDFIRQHKDGPFLVYYPMILTHGPHEPTPDSTGWGEQRKRRKKDGQAMFADMVGYMDKLVGKLDSELVSQGLRDNTLVIFTGDNGSGRGIESELDNGTVQEGEKGNTTNAGMHVPLVANWPGHIKPGTRSHDLVDMTDFLPTICEAVGIKIPSEWTIDGRSFLPQLEGKRGSPREWIYSYWVPLKDPGNLHIGSRGAVEQAFDHRFKLYSTGDFFDVTADPNETRPLKPDQLTGKSSEAARKLQAVLEKFKNARPADLPAPRAPRVKGKAA